MRGVAVYVATPLCNYQFVAGVISVPYVLLSIVPAWPAASLSTRHIPAARVHHHRAEHAGHLRAWYYSKWPAAEKAADHFVLHGSSRYFYSPFTHPFAGELHWFTWSHVEQKVFNPAEYGDISAFIEILCCPHSPRYLISFVLILLRFSLIFKGFQRLASWLLHHFYTISAFGFIGFYQTTPFCWNCLMA